MQMAEAAEASEHKMARLLNSSDSLEIYDGTSNSFFKLTRYSSTEDKPNNWVAERKKGRGSKNSTQWEPLENADHALLINEWMAQQEGRGLVIEKPWEGACLASPVNRATRVKEKDGLLMIRLGDKQTFTELLGGTIVSPVEGPFRQYDGWEPMPEDHFYATYEFLPYTNKFGENGRLGRQAYVDKKQMEKAARVPTGNPVGRPKAKTKSKVDTETVVAAGQVAQSLATAITVVKGEDQKALVETLNRLAKNVSWLLYEDRGEWKGKNNA